MDIHYLCLQRGRALSQYESCTQKMVLKSQFLSDDGKKLQMFIVQTPESKSIGLIQ